MPIDDSEVVKKRGWWIAAFSRLSIQWTLDNELRNLTLNDSLLNTGIDKGFGKPNRDAFHENNLRDWLMLIQMIGWIAQRQFTKGMNLENWVVACWN